MKPDANRVRELFLAAVEKPVAERGDFLEEQCASPEMRAAVERLLAAHDEPASVLDRSAPGIPTENYAPITERPGTKIGPYVLREQLGEGGFGLVFVAEQMEPVKRKVALKVIKPGMDTKHVIARFEQERQALAMMDHPNIARVLDAGSTESGRPYFVMELVRGIPITDYCDQNHLDPSERLQLFMSVCHAIQHAHQKGVIHRDVKPSNVLVTSHDGKPVAKVIDFGVAKAIHGHLTERTIYTNFAQMIGTPLYMSPEQAEMSGLDVDTRSDIYSLGVLLYELLTGSTPIEKKRLAKAAYDEIRRVIREEDPPKPSQRISTCETLPSVAASRGTEPTRLSRMMKGELDWVVMKALEKDRTRRYETANGLALDVQRYLTGEPVSAVPPSAGYQMRKFLRRHKGSVVTAAVVLAGLVIGIAGTTWGLVTARRATAAERNRAEAEQQAKQDALDAAAAERKAREDAQQQRDRAEAAEKRAIDEANAAKAVRDFLTDDLLRQADPLHQAEQQRLTGGNLATLPNPTVVEVLDRAAARVAPGEIEKKFPNMPLVQAGVLKAVGDSYIGLLQWEKAEPFVVRAVSLYRQHLGPDDAATMDAEFKMALVFGVARRIEEARSILRRLAEVGKRLFGPFDDRTLLWRRQLFLVDLSKLFEASPRTVARRLLGSNTEFEKIVNEMRAFRDELAGHFGADHPQTIYASYFLGAAYRIGGDLASALKEWDALSKITFNKTKFRFDHPDVESAMMMHVGALRDAGRNSDAVKLMEMALVAREEQKCTESQMDWEFRHQLGWAYMGEKKYDDAFRVFQKNAEKARPPKQDLRSLESLASVLSNLERYEEARQNLQKALDLSYARNGTALRSWETGRFKSKIGESLLALKRCAEAEPLMLAGYKDYQDYQSQMPSYNSGHMKMAALQLKRLYEELGKPEEAAKWRAEYQRQRATPPQEKTVAK